MTSGSFRFDRFALDPRDRQLRRDDAPVALNARYFDALALLVREHGKLVSKDQFLTDVWRGVPVTDEALTQCIRTLRRQLGDDAARPRFIDTVPKHGYRFVAEVQWVEDDAVGPPPPAATPASPPPEVLRLGLAGTLAGGGAGLVGGLIYGLLGASQGPDIGAASLLLVLMCLTMAVGLLGGAGVAFGIAVASTRARHASFTVLGGAVGGLVVGAVVKLVGLDAFNLLFGRSPGDITGAPEGFLLGAAVGLGAWIGRAQSLRRGVATAAVAGAGAGVAIALLGGRLMGGSLALLAERFPGSRVRLDRIGALVGETGFGPVAQSLTAALEGGLFCGCVAAALVLARRDYAPRQHSARHISSNVVSTTSERP